MKATNKFRKTNTFSLIANEAREIATIVAKYGNELVCVSHQHEADMTKAYEARHTYTLRVTEVHANGIALVDVEVSFNAFGELRENARQIVYIGGRKAVA